MNRGVRYAIALLLLVTAFQVDLMTGNEVSSSLFYVVPVAFAAWFLGSSPGVVFALASAAAWLTAQKLIGVTFSKPSILYWNVTAEGAIYLVTAWVVARVNMDRELLDRESLAVGRLQRELLPHALAAMPGYAWESHYVTSTRAGGDYYDVLPLSDGRVAIIVADATGHGAPAAVLMAMGRAVLHVEMDRSWSASETLARLNHQLSRLLPDGWFLTACLVILDPASGRIDYALAGHDPPLVVRARHGAALSLPDRGGPPLGPFPDFGYTSGGDSLEPGDTLILFTDGVTETMNPSRAFFGIKALRAALDGADGLPLAAVKSGLLSRLDAFAAGKTRSDDATILMLRRLARSAEEEVRDADRGDDPDGFGGEGARQRVAGLLDAN
jgi:serine phosphatase RsbU (regulator of sigma subunit)